MDTRLRVTPAAFRRKAEALVRSGHPDADVTIVWTRTNRCTFANGRPGLAGTMQVSAAGFRSRSMVALLDADGLSVR